MKIVNRQNIFFLKLLARIIGGFWLIVGIMYLIGQEFTLAIIEIVAGTFLILLPNIISKILKKHKAK